MGDWGDKIQNYEQIKANNPEAFKIRNPIVYWKHFFSDLGIDGFFIICLISFILLLYLRRQGWLR